MTSPSSKAPRALVLLFALIALPAYSQQATPRLLQVTRDVLKPGVEQDYDKIEDDAAKLCVTMHCPNPYLAIETIDDPKEVWILNGFDSEDQAKQVMAMYQQNASLLSALKDISTRKQPLLAEPSQSSVAGWVPVLSGGPPWSMADVRYLVITHTRGQPGAMGAVYAAEDGSLFEIRPAASVDEAKAKYATGDPTARIFEVRPKWALPDKSWVSADPTLWAHRTPAAN
jgi:hypothetical protein